MIKNILFAAILLAQICQVFGQEKGPNVIIIFPDQYRQFSLGFWSQGDNAKHIQGKPDPVNTPVLKKIKKEAI